MMIEFLLRICLWADEGGSEKSPSLLVLFPKCSQFEVSGKAVAYFGVPFPEGLQHPLNQSTVPICFLNSKHFLEILLKFSLQSKSHLAKIVIQHDAFLLTGQKSEIISTVGIITSLALVAYFSGLEK